MKNLKSRGYITVSENEYLHLTDEGRKIAESVYERRTLLADWLVHLGVNPRVAASDACKMEPYLLLQGFWLCRMASDIHGTATACRTTCAPTATG